MFATLPFISFSREGKGASDFTAQVGPREDLQEDAGRGGLVPTVVPPGPNSSCPGASAHVPVL